MPKNKTASKKKTTSKKPAAKSAKNTPIASKINKPIKLKNPKKAAIISVVIFVIVCIAAWWQFIFAEPNRVLSDMLAGNLRTPGVIKRVQQGGGQNTITQDTYLSFVEGPRTQSVTTLVQQGPTGQNKVVTENVGVPDTDYIRYRTIDVTGANGQNDTSAAENVWASRTQGEDKKSQQANFLNEGLFSVVAFGNFTQNQADELKGIMDDSGLYSYSSVDKAFENGRFVYKYNIEFKPVDLINYLSEYSDMLGVDDKGQLDAKNYASAQAIQVTLTVDVLSRQLLDVTYPNNGRVEEYHGFGLTRPIDLPDETISVTELQRRLQIKQ